MVGNPLTELIGDRLVAYVLASTSAVIVIAWLSGRTLLQNARQVPSWFTETSEAGFFVFGAEMGTSLRTYAPTPLPFVLWFLIVAFPEPVNALVGGVGFAVGRLLMIPIYKISEGRAGFTFTMPKTLIAVLAVVAWVLALR